MNPKRYPCRHCGYDIAAVPAGICPECGKPFQRFTENAQVVLRSANALATVYLSRSHFPPRVIPAWIPGALTETVSVISDLLFSNVESSDSISPHHILLAILDGPHGAGYRALVALGVHTGQLRDEVLKSMRRGTRSPLPKDTLLPLSLPSQWVVSESIESAHQLHHGWVGTEHLLLALTRINARDGLIALLHSFNIDDHRIRALIAARDAAPRPIE